MKEVKELTCIGCPMGCALEVEVDGDNVISVAGSLCKKGVDYAKKEVVNPTRTVTSILPVINGETNMVSIKTKNAIPKSKISECMFALKGIKVTAPIHIGDVIVENICGTNVCIIATRNVEKK